MKKRIEQHFTFSMIFKKKNFLNLVQEIEKNKNIKIRIKKICDHNCKNGKTIIIILHFAIIEIHEILNKNCVFLHLSGRDKKVFEKIKKELELINDELVI